jgi:Fe-S-cluster containining protein
MQREMARMITIEACKTCTDVCCERTTYKLTNEDFFASPIPISIIHKKDGMVQLPKPCPLYSTYHQRCSFYENRFTGCRIYPVVFIDGKIGIDRSCPGHKEITREQIVEHTPTVLKYMHDITFEAQMRRKEQ